METFECIQSRRTIRKFLDKPLEWDKVMDILGAGRLAPSAGNQQNWKFVVIREKVNKKKISQACFDQDWMIGAAVHIVVIGEPEKAETTYGARGARLYTIQNCASAITNMLLAAHDLGIGACWVGAFDEELIRRTINLPPTVTPQAVIPLGYPGEKPTRPAKSRIEHITFLEAWWGRRKLPTRDYHSDVIAKTIKNTKATAKKFIEKLKSKE